MAELGFLFEKQEVFASAENLRLSLSSTLQKERRRLIFREVLPDALPLLPEEAGVDEADVRAALLALGRDLEGAAPSAPR